MKPDLKKINIEKLDVYTASDGNELRRDLHTFIDYITCRDVKRTYRENRLAKSDCKRLAKVMTDRFAMQEIRDNGRSDWIDFIDWLALQMRFVTYETEGVYMGFSSTEPLFQDNYIEMNNKRFQTFLERPLLKQERSILQKLVNYYSD